MINTANRLKGIGEYYFSQKLREIDGMNKSGKNVINLGIGSPDLAPHPDVIKTLHEASSNSENHAYQNYKGVPVLRNAIAAWYDTWYAVELDSETEILPLMGSKEGIMHICMTYLNEGDQVLVPNPGYPTYNSAVRLAGGEVVEYDLTESNHWKPDFEAMEKMDLQKVKLMFVNYPHMPTGKLPDVELFKQLVKFAEKHEILLIHDNPYSFILNDNPQSILSIDGAKNVVIELNSLSKALNMAGWRVGMMCAAKARIEEVLRFKSNMDSGMFLPVQLAAAKALSLSKDWYDGLNEIYQTRREIVFELLETLNCRFETSQSGLFVWAAIPETYKDGYELSDDILLKANVFITPGGIFGKAGNRYVRVSLCSTVEKLTEAIQRIKNSI